MTTAARGISTGASLRIDGSGTNRLSPMRVAIFAVFVVGCGGPGEAADGGASRMDASSRDGAAAGRDAGPTRACLAPEDCDDGIDCTDDRCDRVALTCVNSPQADACGPGFVCDPRGGCVAGHLDAGVPEDGGGADSCIERDWFRDADDDGFGGATESLTACFRPDGYVDRAGDCDDADREQYPGALEVCNLVDDDCDGEVDEGLTATFYLDLDGDGHGDPATGEEACAASPGRVPIGDDCNDACPACYPAAPELCDGRDSDCDPMTPDGADDTARPGDPCDGEDADQCLSGTVRCDWSGIQCIETRHFTEYCDGVLDEDCDGLVDEGLTSTFYQDFDGDRYAAPGAATMEGCWPTAGWAASLGDCDDADPARHPFATEACNAIDDDCDGSVDETPAESSCMTWPGISTTTSCVSGACLYTCAAGYLDCSGDAYCEVNGISSADHCGTCGNRCSWRCAGGNCETVVSVGGGWRHTCAATSVGDVLCWGNDSYGQVGDGTGTSPDRLSPYRLSSITGVVEVDLGFWHSCARRNDGTVSCWGRGDNGRLGYGGTSDFATPVDVSGISTAVDVAGGGSFSCAALSDGRVACWGQNNYGQLGSGSTSDGTTPTYVSGITNAVGVTAGGYHACAWLADGTARCWGRNGSGQLGRGTSGGFAATPAPVNFLTNVTAMAAGDFHTCAVSSGELYCWGSNANGALGTGSSGGTQSSPTGPIMRSAVAVDAGDSFTCASSTAIMFCWGEGGFGQLGNGTTTDRLAPTPVSSPSSATAITTGVNHTCAIYPDGQLFCWGYNDAGQLGNGTRTAATTPRQIIGR